MCGHSASANKIIEELLHELYPAIQHQFVLFHAAGYEDIHPSSRIHELVTSLKNEFQSLVTYENKLVFSSVLKVFNSASQDVSHLPDIEDLQHLTKHKEQRIAALVSEIEAEIGPCAPDGKEPVLQLVSLFRNEFARHKKRWNAMISNWLTSCNCFKRISNQFHPKP